MHPGMANVLGTRIGVVVVPYCYLFHGTSHELAADSVGALIQVPSPPEPLQKPSEGPGGVPCPLVKIVVRNTAGNCHIYVNRPLQNHAMDNLKLFISIQRFFFHFYELRSEPPFIVLQNTLVNH